MTRKQKIMLSRILATAAAIILLQFLPVTGWLRLALYLAAYLLISYDILLEAFEGVIHGQLLDENFLMAVASMGAFALAIYSGSGDYLEAIAVMLFFQVGELFESYAVGKSRKNITSLMDIRPDYANLQTADGTETVDPEDVPVGSIIVVKPGERVPLDGTVLAGTSTLNTAALTGESLPRDIKPGDDIISGCINLTGLITVQTTKEFGESTVSKILELVEESSSHKSRSEAFITRFARVYTPAVCGAALVLALLPPIINLLLGNAAGWSTWIYRALTFLVVSCPCALVISIPLSFFAGLGAASKEGVLVKGSNYLELLSQVKTVVFDKTGTLTQGVFAVTGVEPRNACESAEALLDLAAHAEIASSHPIAKSLAAAYGAPLQPERVTDIQEVSGKGILAKVDGAAVAVGNGKLMAQVGVDAAPVSALGTIVHVAVGGAYAGYLVISDVVKDNAAAAIANLRAAGVERTVMLTGDAAPVAEAVATELALDEYHAELLPADKVAQVERLLAEQSGAGAGSGAGATAKSGAKGPKLAFVGDGINDAPVLMRADLGIAMGAMGSDAAIEAADVVLMDDNPEKIGTAIKISRKCLRIVKENIGLSLGVKFACLFLCATGLAGMWAAIFADVGMLIIAILNAIRALRV